MEGLDLKDKKILYELDLNARQPDSAIAKRIGLSKEVVRYRINNLVENGYIKKFNTLLNTMKLGLELYRTLFKFRALPLSKEKEMIEWLLPRVSYLTKVKGQWDMNATPLVHNVYEYKDFLDGFIERYGEYIERYDVSVIVRFRYYHRNYLAGIKEKSLKQEMMGFDEGARIETVGIDSTDRKILSMLQEDARMKNVEIARRLGLTDMVVKYRIRKLTEGGVILGFRPLFDARKLGYSYFKVNFALQGISTSTRKRLLAYVQMHPSTVYSMELVGSSDLETHLEVKSNEELYRYIDDMRGVFGNVIKECTFMEYREELKWTYLPTAAPQPKPTPSNKRLASENKTPSKARAPATKRDT